MISGFTASGYPYARQTGRLPHPKDKNGSFGFIRAAARTRRYPSWLPPIGLWLQSSHGFFGTPQHFGMTSFLQSCCLKQDLHSFEGSQSATYASPISV